MELKEMHAFEINSERYSPIKKKKYFLSQNKFTCF